jgi:hypothetical protein
MNITGLSKMLMSAAGSDIDARVRAIFRRAVPNDADTKTARFPRVRTTSRTADAPGRPREKSQHANR